MGYTHYWRRAKYLEKETFAAVVKDIQALISNTKIELFTRFEQGSILIEGTKEETCEPFYLTQKGDEARDESEKSFRYYQDISKILNQSLYFSFCKTRHYPYDLIVMASLLAFKHRFPETIVASDGDSAEWEPAFELCQKVLGFDGSTYLDK